MNPNRSVHSRLASRENLDNLIWVMNCNLQRLDGPVRGNGKIIQELEGTVSRRGLERHQSDLGFGLGSLCSPRTKPACSSNAWKKCVDGDYQKYTVEPGSYIRKHFFGKYPELLELVNDLTDDRIAQACSRRPRSAKSLRRLQSRDGTQRPADGDSRQDRQRLRSRRSRRRSQHHASAEEDERKGAARIPHSFRHSDQRRRNCRISVLSSVTGLAGHQIFAGSPENTGRFHSQTRVKAPPLTIPPLSTFFLRAQRNWSDSRRFDHQRFYADLGRVAPRQNDWTQCRSDYSRRSAHLRHGHDVREFGIYSPKGQLYEPVDAGTAAYFNEAKDGQILKKASTKPVRCPPLSRQELLTPITA